MIRSQPLPSSRRSRTIALAVAATSIVAGACIPVPATSTVTAQAIMDLQDQLSQVQYEVTLTHDMIDSLRKDLNFEDSVLRSLANLAGNPLPPRGLEQGQASPGVSTPAAP